MINSPETRNVVIIGGGWSGLSAACYLANDNVSITLYESSKQLGGRARSIQLDNQSVDNGQHLLIGAYNETITLMQLISADIKSCLTRQPLALNMIELSDNANNSNINIGDKLFLKTVNLPSPFHLFFGVVLCADLSFSQKIRAAYFSLKISSKKLLKNGDISVAELLSKYAQPTKLVKALWEPLCLATLNTPIREASAALFIAVLQKSLLGSKSDSDFLFTSKNLSSILPEPAAHYLTQKTNEIKLSSRANEIIIKNGCVEGVVIDDELISTANLILAIPPFACTKLLANHTELNTIFNQLSQIEYQPICTVYLQYPESTTMNQAMIGSWGGTIQWLFDRKLVNQNGLMAAIISANGPHMELDNESLIDQIQSEIKCLFPNWPESLHAKVVREKRATFSSNINISNLRPKNKTPIKGLWLCGDYTNTDLPATLEGAIISGKLVANEIMKIN